MPRHVKVAAAQMGRNNEDMSREEIVERMLALLDQAVRDGVELIAYPEMALTTYSPKKIRPDFDQFFGGSAIVNPLGQVLARAATTGDELVVAPIDLDQMGPVRKRWNFLGRRQPQHDGHMLDPVTEKETHR